ncbi:MAG: plasmid mobilization relaxosome protein MobC [Rhodospirillales bacterium]|nr:plasmid mobilization relaxosome protein MobC [Rhodospirillales bacterium]
MPYSPESTDWSIRSAKPDFEAAVSPVPQKKRGRPKPFSIRFTFEERARLEQLAGGMPIGAFIRDQLFGDDAIVARRRTRNHHPVKDQKVLGQLLGVLGRSKLANNVNQLARAANSGSLPATPETERAIHRACRDISWMKSALVRALGLHEEPKP